MILYDELITLRAIEDEDAIVLKELINDPEIESSVVGFSYPVSLSQQKKWISDLSSDSTIRYAIDNGDGIVGVATISSLDMKNATGNLNIKLHKNARGKGYATHSLKLLITYCFLELNLNCLNLVLLSKYSYFDFLFVFLKTKSNYRY